MSEYPDFVDGDFVTPKKEESMAKWVEGVKIFLFDKKETCLHCQCETEEPFVVTAPKGKVEHFCSKWHAILYWMNGIREAGL